METLRYEQLGHIGWLRLNRPEKMNAMTTRMWEEMRELGEKLRNDPSLRVLIVIGEGRAFSTGIDTSQFGGGFLGGAAETPSSPPRQSDDRLIQAILRTQDAYNWLEEAAYPTIAAVRGYALGGGLQLALACDLRVLARGTKLGLLEHRYGLLPDLGGTQRLPRLVGIGKAKELIFTAQQLDAEAAFQLGLAEHLVDDVDLESTVTTLAEQIAAQPPLAVRGAKHALRASLTLPLRDGLRVEAEQQSICLRSEDFKEAIRAFRERREPRYKGR
jgi:enoyl-CoA hydratase/carnithine racemase